MNIKQFKEGKEKITTAWPYDKIIENTDNKLVVQCENGDYLIYRFIEPCGVPEIDAIMSNKIMFQYTKDLTKKSYNNITSEIFGIREIKDERIKEVLNELSFRVKIGSVLK